MEGNSAFLQVLMLLTEKNEIRERTPEWKCHSKSGKKRDKRRNQILKEIREEKENKNLEWIHLSLDLQDT